MIVTIDGPAGAGKSSAARALAHRLGFQFLDTGAMYRAVTWYCLSRGIDLKNEAAVADAARELDLQLTHDRVFLNGQDATEAIRTADVTQASRYVAGNNAVRRWLVERQRAWAFNRHVVTEGRDQGTVAFPQAECKFFLTADPLARAARRQQEMAQRGEHAALEEILAQQAQRDARDEARDYGALKPAADALHVDTSRLSLEQVVDALEAAVRARMNRGSAPTDQADR